MALPTIIYDASGGSDTAASGAGPATAVTGSAAAHTGGSASTTITLTNTPDLSGVATDGSAVIWINDTAGNRHLSKITAVDDGADTVTTEDTFNIAAGSAKDYAIGGKRKTLENDTSNEDWADGKEGWVWEFEDGTYALTATATWVATTSSTVVPTTVRAGTAQSPVFTVASNIDVFTFTSDGEIHFIGLKLQIIAGSGAASDCLDVPAGARVMARDCTFDADNGSSGGNGIQCLASNSTVTLYNCLTLARASGIVTTSRIRLYAYGCRFAFGVDGGSHNTITTIYNIIYDSCIFHDNSAEGLDISNTLQADCQVVIKNCVFEDNGGDGIDLTGTLNRDNRAFSIVNCNFDSNGGYGINGSSGVTENDRDLFDYNAFRNNTSGEMNNLSNGPNDVTLTAPPFNNPNIADFALNDTAGGGAACKAVGFPGIGEVGGGQGAANTDSFVDLGAAQRQEPAGGGGLLTHAGMTGGVSG